MSKTVELPLITGGSILIEVDDSLTRAHRDSLEPVSRGSERVAAETMRSFEAALDRVRLIADSVHRALSSLASRPEAASVEFGIKFTAEAGVVLASSGVEANLKVVLHWNRRIEQDDEDETSPPLKGNPEVLPEQDRQSDAS